MLCLNINWKLKCRNVV